MEDRDKLEQDEVIYQAGYKVGEDKGYEDGYFKGFGNGESQGKLVGRRDVVEFIEGNIPKTLANYVGFWHNLQAQKKKWGIK